MPDVTKYKASRETIRTLNVLREHPGINAKTFTGLRWPHLRHRGTRIGPVIKGASYLRLLKKNGLVCIRYSGDPFKEKAECIYYLSDYGFEVCEYYRVYNGQFGNASSDKN